MSRITDIRIQNLRCFDDTGFIKLRPITILVGKNSAGKSTFARLFPLLRQSAEEEKRSPILWYGRLVDFGSFDVAINRNSKNKNISLSFKLSIKQSFRSDSVLRLPWDISVQRRPNDKETPVEVEIVLNHNENSGTTYASSIVIKLFGTTCKLFFSDSTTLSELFINDLRWAPTEPFSCVVVQKNILPSISFLRLLRRKVEDKEVTYRIASSPFITPITNKVKNSVHGKTSHEKVSLITRGLKIGTNQMVIDSLIGSPYVSPTSKQYLTNLTSRKSYVQELKNLLFADALPEILEDVDESFAEYLNGVRYVEPLRATAQRYYRGQDLAVDEIDSKGTNVAMYIDSLSPSEKDKLNLWLKQYFNVMISAKSEGGHVTLILIEDDSRVGTNIADLGVGFSQMLPIVLQLWQASQPNNTRRKTRKNTPDTCIVIEQPELHLHPAYQARIADVMLASLKNSIKSQKSTQIIAETHSPHLINRLGELIVEGQLSEDDVQVIVFQDSDVPGNTAVSTSVFNKEGILQNWPFGFFEP